MSSLLTRIALMVSFAVAGALALFVLTGVLSEGRQQNDAVADQLGRGLAALLGTGQPFPPGLLTVRDDGEAYNVIIQAAASGVIRTDETGQTTDRWLSAVVRPEGRTRLRFDRAAFPASIRLTPEAAIHLAGVIGPGWPSRPSDEPMIALRTQSRSLSGLYDNDPGRDSRFELRAEGIEFDTRHFAGWPDRHVAIGRASGLSRFRQTAAGVADVGAEVTLDGYTSVTENPVLGALRVSARQVVTAGEFGSVMPGRLTAALSAIFAHNSDAAARRAGLRSLVPGTGGVIGNIKMDETLEGLDIRGRAGAATIDRAHFSIGAGATAGRLQLFMELATGGLHFPDLPSQYTVFVPRSVTIRTAFSNLDAAAVDRLLQDLSFPDTGPTMTGVKPVNFNGLDGARLRFEYFDADLGYATVTASFDATVAETGGLKGQADVAMTGLDELMKQVQGMPNSGRVMAALATLKGLGKLEHEQIVWHIVFSDSGKVMVNGIDLTALGAR